jgi:lysophospholipase L1-like esterase
MIIDDIVNKYIFFLEEYNSKFEVIVLGMPTPGKQPNVYNYDHYADFETQWQIKEIFNKKLKMSCDHIGVKYIDIFTEFIGDDKFIDLKYCDDGVHLNENSIPKLKSKFYNAF